jgi:hypothetical protein
LKHPIPRKALDDRLGFIGTSGSGKTYNAGTAIEILLSQNARAVIIDPLGVWWGLRLLADGKKPSNFNVVIFGGDHADLPLNEQAGALIGETAATMAESCIIDLSKLTSRSAERRFMVAFLETIYRKANGEPFHLIVDEADLFAPQKPQAGDEVLLGHMENIVRRGRVRGFIPWLISQRPAVLNKNVLSQVDGLLAFKLTSVQDRDALDAWIEGQSDKAQGKAIKDALPTFPVGEGVVWLPGHGILERKPFPLKVTFDSSKKPKRGEKLTSRKLKPLDVGKLKEQLATVVEEAKANDPKELRATIAALRKEIAAKSQITQKPVLDPAALTAAEARGFERGKKAVIAEAKRVGQQTIVSALEDLRKMAAPLLDALDAGIKTAKIAFPDVSKSVPFVPEQAQRPAPITRAPSRSPSGVAKPPPAASGDGTLTNPQRQLLQALAWWAAMGHEQPTRVQLAAKAGWKPKGSNLRNRLTELSTAGLIEYPASGLVALTETGTAAAPAPDLTGDLVSSIKAELTNPQLQLFDRLLQSGSSSITREELASAVGWEASGSNLRNRLTELSSIEVITYPGRGMVALQDWVVA